MKEISCVSSFSKFDPTTVACLSWLSELLWEADVTFKLHDLKYRLVFPSSLHLSSNKVNWTVSKAVGFSSIHMTGRRCQSCYTELCMVELHTKTWFAACRMSNWMVENEFYVFVSRSGTK